MTRFHISQHMPGFLPESEVLGAVGIQDAVTILSGELDRLKDAWEVNCEAYGSENAAAIGSEHCDWCDVSASVYADIVACTSIEQDMAAKLRANGHLSMLYSPPEGADIIVEVELCYVPLYSCGICSDAAKEKRANE